MKLMLMSLPSPYTGEGTASEVLNGFTQTRAAVLWPSQDQTRCLILLLFYCKHILADRLTCVSFLSLLDQQAQLSRTCDVVPVLCPVLRIFVHDLLSSVR